MRMRTGCRRRRRPQAPAVPGFVVSGLVLLVVFASLHAPSLHAQDPPHWASVSISIDCTSQCHVGHHSLGGGLNPTTGNVNLCQSCHNPSGLASALPINSADSAVPGERGSSHAFDAPAVNAQLDTQAPLDAEMAVRLENGNVVCSTCHNQHRSEAAFGGRARISTPRQVTSLGSTGAVTAGGAYTGAQGVWYLVEITQAGNEGNARFQYSKDNGVSFFPELTAGSDVALDSGVSVTFAAGNYEVGERWEFSAAYPFLRAVLDSGDNAAGDQFCRDCHRSWVMDHTGVETWDGTFKSHPVGVGLNANGAGYDRAAPLDGNGAAQGGAGTDANPTNDLLFDGSGNVQCLTCHGVHYADSNTQTVDVP